MLYYVLTGAHSKTNVLASFVVGQQNNPLDFLASELNRHPDYPGIRDAIPAEEYWSDQLMVVILRAMVRGHKGSFVPSRTDVSSDGIRQLRDELTRLYHLIQREVVAIPVDREWQRRYAQERAKLSEETSELRKSSASELHLLKNFSVALSALCALSILLLTFVYFRFVT